MRFSHFHELRPRCLACRSPDRAPESLLVISHALREQDEDLLEGILRCSNEDCQYEYPVIDGIPFLLPNLREFLAANGETIRARSDLHAVTNSVLGDCCGPDAAFNTTRQHLSSYGWCHYGDLDPNTEDPVAGSTAAVFRACHHALPRVDTGPVIDLGCSVGRITFELARATEQLTLGVDLNVAMLRMASGILRNGLVRYPLRKSGVVYEEREFPASFAGCQQVDFWACDATCLPFAAETFGHSVSLNTLDSVHSPTALLKSIADITADGGTALLACPYDWSSAVTPIENWIGGHSQRADHRGQADRVLQLLLTEPAELSHQLRVTSMRDDIEWTVRLHDRSKMIYQLHVVTLERLS